MKPLNIAQEYEAYADLESQRAAVVVAIDQQIEVLERIIENSAKLCQSPLTYNIVVGLIEQLKTYAPAVYATAEDSLKKQMDSIMEQFGKKSKPLFGDAE
jgi:hypothetical protein